MKFDTYVYTNQGGRAYNEDTVKHKIEGEHGLFILADGLGGHGQGNAASDCVVQALLDGYISEEYHDEEWFKAEIEFAQERLQTLQEEKRHKMKSTLVALAIDNDAATWANVGDSRLYYLSNGKIKAVTEDHSVAYVKYRAGEITKEQIGADEDQSSLLRCLGGKKYTPDVGGLAEGEMLEKGEGFLLCSDGLWEYLCDEEILIDYHKAETAMEWAEWMLLRVMNRVSDNHDNLSLITVLLK